MFGASPASDGTVEFRVWAPRARSVSVLGHELEPEGGDGVFAGSVPASPGDDYRYALDGGDEWPDPCSRFQPDGVRGASRIADTAALPIREAPPLDLDRLVVYELHVGAFSPEGTFDGAIPRLPELRAAGITAIEVMPVATFPGTRGWGYDGLYTFAPHAAYGGPEGLARLVDAAHAAGLGVILDVVYNHVGPGDEALEAYGPYFTGRHDTFWGKAIDYSRRPVREWAIQNAELLGARLQSGRPPPRRGARGLRRREPGARPPRAPARRVHDAHPGALVISEMEIGDERPIREWGHDAQWEDSLHHALHALLTGERDGYYADFGRIEDVARALNSSNPRFVACAQNHDQVGNRALGDRLAPAQDRLALTAVLFSRATPLVFMGEELGETRPFRFFTDHVDPEIAQATREGRKREFEAFTAFSHVEIPDPQAPSTFESSRLGRRRVEPWFREAVALRAALPDELETEIEGERTLRVRRGDHTLTLDFDTLQATLS
jgi:maltooligosyltrehalose trehalohydrolase